MTMRLDLRTRSHEGFPHVWQRVLIRPDCFGCADCGQWFQFARELVQHVCEARAMDEGTWTKKYSNGIETPWVRDAT